MSKDLYIVHCVDTEGPLYESLEETFNRIDSLFGIRMDPTLENLRKLQQKKLDLGGLEESVFNLVAKERVTFNTNWNEIGEMLEDIQSNEFRAKMVDKDGKGWVYNWFCLDHVNMNGINPRKRDLGHHKVFDYYSNKTLEEGNQRDYISWHYHPIPYTQNYHNSGVAYLNSQNIWEILARKIIERNWFPSTYRPGFHTIRPDSNWFLEQWIPFDFSNQSTDNEGDQPDLTLGRYGDWRRATKSWTPYHPDIDDYQKKGNCRRWIFRCLNMEARLRELTQLDVDEAFKQADSGETTVLSFTNHDFRKMSNEIDKIRSYIKRSQVKFPDVQIIFSSAINAAREVLNLRPNRVDLNLELIENKEDLIKIKVTTNSNIFGPQPFLAIKTKKNEYIWENFDKGLSDFEWYFTFDSMHIPSSIIDKIGIAANSFDGTTEVVNLDVKSLQIHKYLYNHE